MTTVLGIDVGGSGIKAAPVDVSSGRLLADRRRIPTPQPATPKAVADTVGELARDFGWHGPAGATFPAVIKHGVVHTAVNVDPAWIGTNAAERFSEAVGAEVTVMNDADAAGVAEMRFGAGHDQRGVVVMVTLGTGIGTALFADGVLVPNTELGHLELDGVDAERLAADSVREAEDLSWKVWSARLQEYLRALEALLWPDLFIVGGGVSKKAEKFLPRLHLRTEVVPAALQNDAGIVGAALARADVSPLVHAD